MSLLVKSVNGEPVIEGEVPDVQRFSSGLLDNAETDWLSYKGGLITLRDRTARVVVYRATAREPGWVVAELVSDTYRERSQ